MIIRPRPSLISLFFILKGSILSAILPKLLLVFVSSCLIAYAHTVYPGFFKNFSVTPFTLMGLSLSIFLGFRNNACYERWWEARKLLGQLIFELRSLARPTALVPNAEDRQRIVKRGIGSSSQK